MRTIAITGPRLVHRDASEVHGLFTDYLGPFVSSDTHWLLGGASGMDTYALNWLAQITSQITVAVPVTVSDQPADAASAIREMERAGRLEKIVELRHPDGIGQAAWSMRNRWLVDSACLVIGFPHATAPDLSGTWETLAYAELRARARLVVPLDLTEQSA
jgi:hypothetical protein